VITSRCRGSLLCVANQRACL